MTVGNRQLTAVDRAIGQWWCVSGHLRGCVGLKGLLCMRICMYVMQDFWFFETGYTGGLEFVVVHLNIIPTTTLAGMSVCAPSRGTHSVAWPPSCSCSRMGSIA